MFMLKGSFQVEVLFFLSIMTNNSVSCLTDFQQILCINYCFQTCSIPVS